MPRRANRPQHAPCRKRPSRSTLARTVSPSSRASLRVGRKRPHSRSTPRARLYPRLDSGIPGRGRPKPTPDGAPLSAAGAAHGGARWANGVGCGQRDHAPLLGSLPEPCRRSPVDQRRDHRCLNSCAPHRPCWTRYLLGSVPRWITTDRLLTARTLHRPRRCERHTGRASLPQGVRLFWCVKPGHLPMARLFSLQE